MQAEEGEQWVAESRQRYVEVRSGPARSGTASVPVPWRRTFNFGRCLCAATTLLPLLFFAPPRPP